MRSGIILLFILLIGVMLVSAVIELPLFGAADAPSNNMVSQRYINAAAEETLAVNSVAAIILDYRAFDTLGEATVLFVGVIAVSVCLQAHSKRGKREDG